MNNEEAEKLIQKFITHTATDEEIAVLNSWYNMRSRDISSVHIDEETIKNIGKQLADQLAVEYQPKSLKLWFKYSVAAAVLICFGIYFSIREPIKTNPIVKQIKKITPGKQAATLILSSGKQIILDDQNNGELAKESGISITKTKDGQLVYQINNPTSTKYELNTLVTARGETYQVKLPDGSLVWLNAESKLSYTLPLNKEGKRRVDLTGEAYFEVARDPKHPFIVKTASQEVEVLGTQFNISSYAEDLTTMTTLVEGSVEVRVGKMQKLLAPTQQSVLNGTDLAVKHVNVDQVVAWKNGLFLFNDEPLESIMKKLARWYDVDIQYNNVDKTKLFWGGISRYENIGKVLDKLKLAGDIKFKTEGRKIIINE